MKGKKALLLASAAMLIMTSACSGSDTPKQAAQEEEKQEPIKLTVLQYLLNVTDEDFNKLIAEPVKAKFPNITMELVRKPANQSFEDMLTAGTFPDMMLQANFDIYKYTPLGLAEDLNSYIKKSGLDMSKFDPNIIQTLQSYGSKGELYMLPLYSNPAALYYNKDIFDRFGVPYPKDGITWDETIDLARQLSKTDGGQQYYGLDLIASPRISASMMLPLHDPKTGKAFLTSDAWKSYFEMYKSIKDIPGNQTKGIFNDFEKNKNLAMMVAYNRLNQLEELHQAGTEPNWDIVTFPSRKEAPLVKETDVSGLLLSTQSKHKEEAFKVMAFLTEMDSQARMARRGLIPVIQDKDATKDFGADLASLQGKNIPALLKMKIGQNPPPTEYEEIIKDVINKSMNEYLKGKLDVNTVLRQAEDEANKRIEEAKR
ncbi:extracellular solute-binding protein [Paenibacillus doosanensis]|uniref:Bacterial extracellular solute-binding protein n=1 Tax=Paenibacillus konkukensis TaxID=2020716 RepID=A0ABY4RF71_9BACL|nr:MULTISPECIES: extracellular solute-binding protein [Paenibacillus]MCS7461351.1 extracellular solute-binding protein [Paenibacillus doosanensis]UQZ81117.1 Bacterial extracellular solute-binding protein [Paenibacillus konkukensis]